MATPAQAPQPKPENGVELDAKIKLSPRNVIAILAIVLSSFNFIWCIKHDAEIQQLKKMLKPEAKELRNGVIDSRPAAIVQSASSR